MFDIGSSELLLIMIVAIVVIGPKDLPRALYKLGQIIGQAKGMARHFRTGIDAMVREAELEELQKIWARDNERIMTQSQGEISQGEIGQSELHQSESHEGELGGTMTTLAETPALEGPPTPPTTTTADAAPHTEAEPGLPLDAPRSAPLA